MPDPISLRDIESITPGEFAHGTTRFIPELHEIPTGFTVNNQYRRIVDAMFYGEPIPEMAISFNEGFPQSREFGEQMKRFIMANLRSLECDTDHKLAGTAYLLSQIITIG